LFYIIAHEQSGGSASAPEGLSATTIYTLRVAHHVAPFSLNPPFGGWWTGLAVTVCLAIVVAVLVRRGHRNVVMLAALIGLVELILAVPMTWLDRDTFLLSKLYLFRPSSITLLLVLCGLLRVLKDRIPEKARLATNLVLCGGVGLFVTDAVVTHVTGNRRPYVQPEFTSLVAAIGSHTLPNDIVLIDPENEDNWLKLHRVIKRPTLVAYKFLPTDPNEILRWHELLELRKRIYETGCSTPMPDMPIRWLVSTHLDTDSRPMGCGPVVWREGRVGLIQISSASSGTDQHRAQ
jgi:hypothetical protein